MQYNAKAPYIVETHWQIEEVLDGDSIIICHRFTQMKKEIRLYGLDAPEVKLIPFNL
jgi:micrococcal nuclease